MDQNERKKLEEGLELFLDEGLERLLLSHPTEPSGCSRSRIRPLLLKGELVFQAEEQIGKQAFHRNLTKEEAVAYVCQMLNKNFRQAEMSGIHGTGVVLVSKKGKITVKIRRKERTRLPVPKKSVRALTDRKTAAPFGAQPQKALYSGRGNPGSFFSGSGGYDGRRKGCPQPL